MLHLSAHNVRIGDTARFPLGRLGDDATYRHRWTIDAFTTTGIVIRRMADGFTKTISPAWWDRYRLDDHVPLEHGLNDGRAERLARLRQARLEDARHHLMIDPTRPGYYVSARKGLAYVLLLGAFDDHYSALQMVSTCWPIVRRYDDPFCEIGVGTCRTETSAKTGKFNAEVFGR